jgi:urea transport system substrate-binding protein
VVSTINGDANVPFYKELGNQGVSAKDIPVVAFSVGEEELSGIDTKPLVGHLAAWNYFMSIKMQGQRRLHQGMAHVHQEPEARDQRPDGSALHRLQHVGEGGGEGQDHRPDKVIDAMVGVEAPNLTGGVGQDVAQPPHHQAGADRRNPGRWPVRRVWKTKGLVEGDAWSDFLPGSKDIIADWADPKIKCGNYNTVTKKCSGQNYK